MPWDRSINVGAWLTTGLPAERRSAAAPPHHPPAAPQAGRHRCSHSPPLAWAGSGSPPPGWSLPASRSACGQCSHGWSCGNRQRHKKHHRVCSCKLYYRQQDGDAKPSIAAVPPNTTLARRPCILASPCREPHMCSTGPSSATHRNCRCGGRAQGTTLRSLGACSVNPICFLPDVSHCGATPWRGCTRDCIAFRHLCPSPAVCFRAGSRCCRLRGAEGTGGRATESWGS